MEKGVRPGRNRSPLSVCAFTETVTREGEITGSGAFVGRRCISNLRYPYDTTLYGKYRLEINNIAHKLDYAKSIRLLKLNARKTKLVVLGDENAIY